MFVYILTVRVSIRFDLCYFRVITLLYTYLENWKL